MVDDPLCWGFFSDEGDLAHICPAVWAGCRERRVDACQHHRPEIAGGRAIILSVVATQGKEGLEEGLHCLAQRRIGGVAAVVGDGRASLWQQGTVQLAAPALRRPSGGNSAVQTGRRSRLCIQPHRQSSL